MGAKASPFPLYLALEVVREEGYPRCPVLCGLCFSHFDRDEQGSRELRSLRRRSTAPTPPHPQDSRELRSLRRSSTGPQSYVLGHAWPHLPKNEKAREGTGKVMAHGGPRALLKGVAVTWFPGRTGIVTAWLSGGQTQEDRLKDRLSSWRRRASHAGGSDGVSGVFLHLEPECFLGNNSDGFQSCGPPWWH